MKRTFLNQPQQQCHKLPTKKHSPSVHRLSLPSSGSRPPFNSNSESLPETAQKMRGFTHLPIHTPIRKTRRREMENELMAEVGASALHTPLPQAFTLRHDRTSSTGGAVDIGSVLTSIQMAEDLPLFARHDSSILIRESNASIQEPRRSSTRVSTYLPPGSLYTPDKKSLFHQTFHKRHYVKPQEETEQGCCCPQLRSKRLKLTLDGMYPKQDVIQTQHEVEQDIGKRDALILSTNGTLDEYLGNITKFFKGNKHICGTKYRDLQNIINNVEIRDPTDIAREIGDALKEYECRQLYCCQGELKQCETVTSVPKRATSCKRNNKYNEYMRVNRVEKPCTPIVAEPRLVDDTTHINSKDIPSSRLFIYPYNGVPPLQPSTYNTSLKRCCNKPFCKTSGPSTQTTPSHKPTASHSTQKQNGIQLLKMLPPPIYDDITKVSGARRRRTVI